MECLDANAVQDLMAGSLAPADRADAIAHMDACTDCRSMVALLAREAAGERASGLEETVSPVPASPDLARTLPSGPRPRSSSVRGRLLGRYTLHERLGAGAMGVVYRAADAELGRDVALKLLRVPDPALTERLVREARSMAQVNHPNVVAVYEVGAATDTDEDATFIAMELVDGTSLRAWQQGQRGVPEILAHYLAAGRGLAAAHAAGIIHRDFKPDNVLVGADGRVRVTDFGLAALRTPDARDTSAAASAVGISMELTQSGTVLGTPAYMAPEQFAGGNIDPRTDQFAFCVSLFEALYGQRPFTGRTYEELADHVLGGTLRPVPPNPRVSRSLRAIVVRGLSARPGDRYPTLDHLLAELGRDRAKPWRRAAIAAAALAAVLGLGIGADFVVRDRVEDEIAQSFAATGVQTNRAFRLLVQQFDANANQMYHQSAMVALSAHRDEAEFQLGDPADDERNREELHASLVSTDWSLWRQGIGSEALVLAVGDRQGRLFYTSAAPSHWRTNLTEIPWLAKLVASGAPRAIVLQRMADPHIARTGMLGPAPAGTLGFFFARLHVVNQEITSYIVQALDAELLIPEIQLDDEMLLSIVSPDGAHAGNVPAALGAAAPRDGATIETRHAGESFLVKSHPLSDRDGQAVGHVLMARRQGGVISGLFPGARAVFAALLLGMLAVATAAARHARRVAGRA